MGMVYLNMTLSLSNLTVRIVCNISYNEYTQDKMSELLTPTQSSFEDAHHVSATDESNYAFDDIDVLHLDVNQN